MFVIKQPYTGHAGHYRVKTLLVPLGIYTLNPQEIKKYQGWRNSPP